MTQSTQTTTTTTVAPSALGWGRGIRLGVLRIGYEVKLYFRQRDTVFFTFLFPLVFLTIFAVAFGDIGDDFVQIDGAEGIDAATYYLPAMLAAGLILSGLQNLSIDIAAEKSDGTLKRLAGTPLPVVSYFIGKFGQVFVTGIVQAILLLALARFAFGVDLPSDAAAWATFAWVFVLGTATSAVLGIALSAVPRSGKSATAVIIPIVLVLEFISGVFLQFSMLPTWLQNVAGVFPLKWMAQGMRAVFLPDQLAVAEQGGEWNLTGVVIALAIWLVVGVVVCALTFRWVRKN